MLNVCLQNTVTVEKVPLIKKKKKKKARGNWEERKIEDLHFAGTDCAK